MVGGKHKHCVYFLAENRRIRGFVFAFSQKKGVEKTKPERKHFNLLDVILLEKFEANAF